MAAKSYVESLLGERERVILVARHHWFVLFGSIIAEIVIALVIFGGSVAGALFFPQFAGIVALVGFLVLLLPILSMIKDILEYASHQYIITNRRVMQITGVFNKNVIDSSLDKVNDVKMSQSFLGRIFDYGNIEILTASELGVNLFDRIENPIHFKTAMLNAKEELESERREPSPEVEASDLLEQINHLHQQGILNDAEYAQKKEQLLARMK
jgi:uncharacterized membrane protein YdbT with pleckstrin-like domain